MSVSTLKKSDFTPDISKNLTSFCMSGKETLITNKFGCLKKTNILLSGYIYLMGSQPTPDPYHTTLAGTVSYQQDDH